MADIMIIGATGGVGSRLGPLLVEAGHVVRGLHRKPLQAARLRDAGLTPVQGDLTDMTPDAMKETLLGRDAVVFSAGAGGAGRDLTDAIDGRGAKLAIAAAEAAGVRRFYMVSVFPEAGRTKDLGAGFEHYMAVKKDADVALAASGLDWVMLRPGTLTDQDGDGHVRAGPVIPYGQVARGNVAAALAALIDRPGIAREIVELTDGDMPVARAMDAIARG